ncbi:MAG TPA: hypothetical protein VL329_01900 [Nitrospiraceae bacterium]|nr:hypothetical protein [Nitrospiraceae bacterium]
MITRRRQIRLRWQQYRRAIIFSPLVLAAAMTGCGKDIGRHVQETLVSVAPPATAGAPYPSLAGTWEYEERGNTMLITLNEYGNGTYDWKDGRFMTATYSNGVWKGSWSQRENDRDGEFEVILSQDRPAGEGRWWYTRIGSDMAPTHPGGVFQIARRSDHSSLKSSASDHSAQSTHHRQTQTREGQ